jgi:hypothetical protein
MAVELNAPNVPLSNPSSNTVMIVHAVGVDVVVFVVMAVLVAVGMGGVVVATAVAHAPPVPL